MFGHRKTPIQTSNDPEIVEILKIEREVTYAGSQSFSYTIVGSYLGETVKLESIVPTIQPSAIETWNGLIDYALRSIKSKALEKILRDRFDALSNHYTKSWEPTVYRLREDR